MKMKHLLFAAAVAIGLGTTLQAATLAEYTFTGDVATPSSSHPFVAATPVTAPGTTVFGTAAGFPNPPYFQGNAGWGAADQASAKAFSFTLNELNGATLTPTNLFLRHRATGAGPSAMAITVNGDTVHTQDLLDSVTEDLNIPLTDYEDLASVAIEILGWNNGSRTTTGGGQFRIDDILVEGTVDEPAGSFPPTVGPPSRTARTDTTLSLSANLNATGGPDVTERGFYYSTVAEFTPPGEGTKVSETGTFGAGVFSLILTGLDPDTEYFVQTFATNSEGSGFSPEVSFTTLKSPPPDALAWYTFTDNLRDPEVTHPEVTAEEFQVSPGTLNFGTAQATTWEALGADMPYIQSSGGWGAADQASAKHFLIEMEADAGRAMTITNISFIHRRTGTGPQNTGVSINGAVITSAALDQDSTEVVSLPIAGFENLTSAVVRFEGWNASGTGDYRVDNVLVQGFVDDEVVGTVPPAVSSPTSADIDGITATLGGTIDDTGDTTVVERGIYWSTIMGFDPELDGTKVSQAGSFGTGSFTVSVGDLEPESTIYFVAFARNAAGSGFSDEDSFLSGEAPPELPTVTTPTATDIGETGASLGGDIESDGGAEVTRRGVVWSTSQGFDPEMDGSVIDEVGSFGTGPFSVSATGLDPATRVYFRAFAENSVGTAFSDEAFFFTTPAGALAFYAFSDSTPVAQTVAANVNAGPVTVNTGSATFASANAASWTGSGVPYIRSTGGWTAETQEEAKHFIVELTTEPGSVMTITNVTLLYRSTGAGPSAVGMELNTSVIYSEDATSNATTMVSIPVSGYEDLVSATLLIQGWDNESRVTSGGGDLQLDDILIQGFVDDGAPPPDGPDFDDIDYNAALGRVEILFMSEVGRDYELSYTTDLTEEPEPLWILLDGAPGTGGQIQLIDNNPIDSMRIYRITGN